MVSLGNLSAGIDGARNVSTDRRNLCAGEKILHPRSSGSERGAVVRSECLLAQWFVQPKYTQPRGGNDCRLSSQKRGRDFVFSFGESDRGTKRKASGSHSSLRHETRNKLRRERVSHKRNGALWNAQRANISLSGKRNERSLPQTTTKRRFVTPAAGLEEARPPHYRVSGSMGGRNAQ